MQNPILVEGADALGVIVHRYLPVLVKGWPGDEALVAMLAENAGGTAVIWAARAQVVDDFTRRGATERDARRRQRYEAAVTALTSPRAPGKVSLVVAGWGDLVAVEIEAEDLRAGRSITSWNGGSA